MNASDLIGAHLDCWVARAEGFRAEVIKANGMEYCRIDVETVGHQFYQPTQNPAITAPIQFRQRYTLYPLDETSSKGAGTRRIWIAEAQMNQDFHDMYRDEQPLVAICRLRVAEAVAAGVIKF
ncbi:phage protein NinX family protein [Paraburkholderia phenoliruptrix]|uniref:phage protein NinX family protein n=1 Tax=Paraburkholderia phenoliruptrix TaxID=252970 RepID=UPI001C4F7520|nr:phage protein NinX family protein [Paraburkholderia phenoliruptrix]MBW0450858.1 DUF2591 family protein [Paraburkholderia phenoliruptrix]MBW9100951.1 DUF2591 family protein [Paraburkholderia phenoliruptrix]